MDQRPRCGHEQARCQKYLDFFLTVGQKKKVIKVPLQTPIFSKLKSIETVQIYISLSFLHHDLPHFIP